MISVGTRVKIVDPSSHCHGKLGTVKEGPERKQQGYVYDYLVEFDEPAENGALVYVGHKHEIEVLP